MPRGAKTGLSLKAISSFYDSFSISELKRECPDANVDMIRKTLKDLNKKGKINSLGRGQNARWTKANKWN